MLRAAALALVLASAASAQTDAIRLNQVGFYPEGPKVAVAVGGEAGPFVVRPEGGGEAVFRGELGPVAEWSASGERVRQADFSRLATPGAYVVEIPGLGVSHPFEIRARVHEPVARAALKGYYFQRASTALDSAHAGVWSRAAGHPDTHVVVHPSASTPGRPAGTVLSSPRGWYDAGDYNKYIVNSGITVGTLLSAYEWNPAYVAALDVGIPESGNGLPDLIDEVLWNVRWMLTLQDEDGGVYHKLTTADFSGEVMPAEGTDTRYVVQKGTAATLGFAATLAQASRVVRGFDAELPGLADSLLAASLDAWAWARAHPAVRYRQADLNARSDPDIQTGEYGDGAFDDELDWAALELYVTTRADSFLAVARPLDAAGLGIPWWQEVRELGLYSLLAWRAEIATAVDTAAVRSAVLDAADRLVDPVETSAYGVTMQDETFYWGSNSVAANHGVLLALAHQLTGEARYLDAATATLDYLLGRNAVGMSFLTGVGARSPQHIHHRPSRADGVPAPVPGLLVGGPNPAQQDGCDYASALPAASYADTWCSYASNEIAINWNAPLVHLAVSVEAARSAAGVPGD